MRNKPDAIRSKEAGAIRAAKATMEVDSLKVHEFNSGALRIQFKVKIGRTQAQHRALNEQCSGHVLISSIES